MPVTLPPVGHPPPPLSLDRTRIDFTESRLSPSRSNAGPHWDSRSHNEIQATFSFRSLTALTLRGMAATTCVTDHIPDFLSLLVRRTHPTHVGIIWCRRGYAGVFGQSSGYAGVFGQSSGVCKALVLSA
ncbi:hypothetical protein FA13DRAFT_1165448 [Coprinellus micaceus]|uniref:Uncharacterized protein n=1 Tax=Coprinellus micaceus TaxID=71717 RepID=A0A4Y7RDF4_COPMI|nr:hypothetical protein FA13DRAFT_1165448 [Coprinellus micaceus]